MQACTFFGHRECPAEIGPVLKSTLVDLITNHGVDMFYVGKQGQFDAMVRRTLKALSETYPHIRYAVVLAYLPGASNGNADFSDTMLPEGIEAVHPKFAISRRNDWMLRQSGFVVTYVTRTWGGACKFAEKAKKQGKTVINLA